MSLRIFHLLFIGLAIALSAWVGAWGVHRFRVDGAPGDLVLGVLFFALGATLILYGVRAARKLREVGR